MFTPPLSRIRSFRVISAGAVLLSLGTSAAQQVEYSSVRRNGQHALPQTLTGGTPALRSQLASERSSISLAVADFDRDGTLDLVTGYATSSGGALTIQRGSPAATSPSPSDWAAMQRGELVTPFVASANTIELPVRPDFLKAVDLDGNGTIDVVVAARGDSSTYLLRGNGSGGFSAAQAIPAGGAVTALATWRGPEGANYVVAGICNGSANCGLRIMAKDGSVRSSVPLPGAAGAIEVASLNGGFVPDLAVAAGGNVILVDGDSVLRGAPQTEALPVSGAVSVAAGNFVYDRRGFPQLAVLSSDATLHILVRVGIDSSAATAQEIAARRSAMRLNPKAQVGRVKQTGMAWSEPETVLNVGPGSGSGDPPLMFRARLSGGGYDDLAVLEGGQFVTVAHPLTLKDGEGKTTPKLTIDSTSNPIVAAVPARISPNARQGVVFTDGTPQPRITLLPTNNTFTVTTTTDGTHSGTTCTGGAACTIRDAVALANKDAAANGQTKVDTINIPAGTYTFTTAFHPANDSQGSINYHFDLDASIDIVGAGSGTTILNGNSLDKIFSADSGVVNAYAPYDIFISGVTMENGTNNNNPSTAPASNFYGGLIDWESYGPGNLTLNNVVMTNGTALNSGGGALFTSDSNDSGSNATEGLVEIDNSTVSNSNSPELGGGIFLGSGCPALFNTVTLSGNHAVTSVNSADTAKDGSGGAIYSFGSQATGLTTITNSTITNNTATDSGGGAAISGGLAVSGTSFTGNTAGAFGGGLYYIGASAGGTITSSTFTGNSVIGGSGQTYGGVYQIDGGGICNQSYGTTAGSQFGALTMHYSRIHGNTGGHATGLGIGCSSGANQYSTVNATDNWWGCNGAATGTGCDTALAASTSTQTLTLTPFTTLIISITSTTPQSGSTFTATGSVGQDSSNTVYTTPQNAALSGVPATLSIVQNGGGTTNSSATTLNSSAAIATTATAGAVGPGIATVTVDGTAVTASFTVTPLPASKLVFETTPASPIVSGGNAGMVTVQVEDSSNNVVTGSSTTIALTVTGPGSYSQTYTVVTSTGVATFGLSGVPLLTAGTYTYTAISGSLTPAQATEIVNPGAAVAFKVTGLAGFPAPGIVGSATVTAVDSNNNTVTNYTGTVTLTSSDTQATLPAPYAFQASDNGVHVFSVTLETAGTQSVTASDGSISGTETGIVVADSIWLINANSTLDRLTNIGGQSLTAGSPNGTSTSTALAFDNNGGVWAVANANSVVLSYSRTGIPLSVPGNAAAGVNTPVSIAIDGLGQVWVANGNNSVSVLNSAGAAVTPSTGYQGGAMSSPTGIIIDSSGSVWLSNSGNNSVTKIIGGAAPVTTPIVTGTTNNTLGTRP